jgi:hypothetical protein
MPQCQSGPSSKSSKPLVRAMEVSDEQALLNKNGSGIGRECGPAGETLQNWSSAGSLVFWFLFGCHVGALPLSSPERLPRRAARGLGARSPHQTPVRLSPGILARGLIAKRAVGTTFILFDTPAFQDNARFVRHPRMWPRCFSPACGAAAAAVWSVLGRVQVMGRADLGEFWQQVSAVESW